MAIYTTSQSTNAGKCYASGVGRQRIVRNATVAVTTAMIDNVNDEVGLFYVPKGFIPTALHLDATAMDTDVSATLAFDIGDDGDEDRLLAADTTAQAGGRVESIATTGFLYKYTAKTLIKAYVQAVAATGAAGTLKVTLYGVVDEDFDTTALTAS